MMMFIIFACSEKPTNDTSSTTNTETEITIDTLGRSIAEEVCTATLNCCDADSQDIYFNSYLQNENLEEYAASLPPNATLDQESCVSVMEEMLGKIWFGSWKEQVSSGLVTFNANEASACLDELKNASCGEEARAALFDGECFGYAAPGGGDYQRRIFTRDHQADDACQPILDGFGGMYFGSCDPSSAFCCLPSDSFEGCHPYPSSGLEGTCQAVAQEGESCSTLPPIQPCASGLECDYNTNVCVGYNTQPLSIGEQCYDADNYGILGVCSDSWCDLFGTGNCEPLLADGESCMYGESCETNYCDPVGMTCIENPICESE